MTHRFLRRAALLSVLAVAPGFSAAADANDAATLAALDHAMQKAVVDRDPAAFADFLTDDYVLVVSTSRMATKAEVVAEIDAPGTRMEVNDSTDLRIRVHGDTALVIADLHQVGRHHDQPFDYWVRYTDTWIRTPGGWKCASGHATRLAR